MSQKHFNCLLEIIPVSLLYRFYNSCPEENGEIDIMRGIHSCANVVTLQSFPLNPTHCCKTTFAISLRTAKIQQGYNIEPWWWSVVESEKSSSTY